MTTTVTAQSLIKYLNDLNPTIDTSDPIIQDLIVNFGIQVITDVQTRVSNLSTLYTNAYLNQLSDNDLNIYAYNALGLVRYSGTAVTGYVYFLFSWDNSSEISIPSGTIVSTNDNVWRFITTQNIYLSGNSIRSLYNPIRNAYEIRVPVQATLPGTDYRVAAYRINTIQSTLTFNCSVENRDAFVTGTDPESREDFINRINKGNAGFNLNSSSGLRDSLLSGIEGLQDIQFLHAPGLRNTYNLYYIGYQPVADVLEYAVANPTNKEIFFDSNKVPIRYVDSVVLDGVTLSLNQYRYTPTKVVLLSTLPVTSSSVIFISYQYNQLNFTIKDYLNSNVDFPGSIWNVQEGIPDFIKVTVNVKPQNYMTLSEISSLVSSTLIQYLNPNQFIVGIQASAIRSLLLDIHTYLLNCEVSINEQAFFNFEEGHYPVLTSENISVGLLG
jgi:hypothetical protein